MKSFYLFSVLLILYICNASDLRAQCETWHNNPQQKEITDSYILYRQNFKSGSFDTAFTYWTVVYYNAPAADGSRSQVYIDGVKMLEEQFKLAKRKKDKKEIADFILRLIDEQKDCYPNSKTPSPSKNLMEFRSEI